MQLDAGDREIFDRAERRPLRSGAFSASTEGRRGKFHAQREAILAEYLSSMTPEMEKAYMDTLTIALRTGYQILSRGGTSLDAVEATIRVMEDCPLFNCREGRGVHG